MGNDRHDPASAAGPRKPDRRGRRGRKPPPEAEEESPIEAFEEEGAGIAPKE